MQMLKTIATLCLLVLASILSAQQPRNIPDWYIGAITNSAARKITVPLDFLPDGTHKATIYSDAADAATRPDNLERKSLEVSNKAVLPIQLATGGGAAIRITL